MSASPSAIHAAPAASAVPAPRRILVICIRRLGDVLLSTALVRSLRAAWPQARIEMLVNAGSVAAVEGNPDLDALVVQPERARPLQTLRLMAQIFRRYDLAVCTLYGDRPHLYALAAAPRRAAVVPPMNEPGARWKRRLSQVWRELRLGDVHAVEQYLTLADALGIERQPVVVPPRAADDAALVSALGARWAAEPYAVIHPQPMYRYKAWTLDGWVALARALVARGLAVRITGGPAPSERALAEAILGALSPQERASVRSTVGLLQFRDLSLLLERCEVFVGPDTSVTHLAAACGCPTVALFGPSHPVAWGPWPQGWTGQGSPWVLKRALQSQGKVWIVQGEGDCVPCLKQGCDDRLDSRADCLDGLGVARVLEAVDAARGVAGAAAVSAGAGGIPIVRA